MKKYFIILAVLLMANASFGQSLNPSFESWGTLSNTFNVNVLGLNICGNFSYLEPLSWSSTNQLTGSVDFGAIELVTEIPGQQAASSAIQMQSVAVSITPHSGSCTGPIVTSFNNVAPGLIVSGAFNIDEQLLIDEILAGSGVQSLNPFSYPNTGQPIAFMPSNLKGSYQYTGVNNDSALIFSGVMKDGEILAYAISRLGNAANWTPFEIEYVYKSCEVPDTIITVITSSNLTVSFDPLTNEYILSSDYTGENGSILKIDDLSMDTVDLSTFPPIAVNDSAQILVDQTATLDLRTNDLFCDGSMPVPVILIDGLNGSTTINGLGEAVYTPNAGFSGSENITYYVCNGASLCDTAIWNILISAAALCEAVDDNRSLVAGGSSVFDPLLNDIDCGGTPSIVVIPQNGTAQVEPNGFISYSPVVGFSGLDSLTYRICSPINTSQCSTAKIYYTVLTSLRELPATYFQIAPNPANSYISIKLENKSILSSVHVYDVLGGLLDSYQFVGQIDMDLSAFQEGVYVFHLENAEGSASRKVVLAR
ncbi:MAG: T9SS type A sorting domain-containing protein [Chitinophagales bacterium]|nr:T9SS type A sorting domain-containing protein [Chitinophagales bacterium]